MVPAAPGTPSVPIALAATRAHSAEPANIDTAEEVETDLAELLLHTVAAPTPRVMAAQVDKMD